MSGQSFGGAFARSTPYWLELHATYQRIQIPEGKLHKLGPRENVWVQGVAGRTTIGDTNANSSGVAVAQ